uniref:Uncharacterized protein n=1 Tax=Labrus bergylta TaxID=56723 RepID=A0A3Q3E2F0_9LABR
MKPRKAAPRGSIKMAAVGYFPSIHDNSPENRNIWTPYESFTSSSAGKGCRLDAFQNSFSSQHVEDTGLSKKLACLAAPDYQPLDVFVRTAEGPRSASCSNAEEICELSIKLKEIELCNMMKETPDIPQSKLKMIMCVLWLII